ncbi:hypothetical protein P2318_14255 [Myxococcaceae bacterium GXIMD 01537]
MIRRYWVEFADRQEAERYGLGGGCGVSGYDREDALELIRERIFPGLELPRVSRIVEDVDVSSLDEGHVLPNIAPPVFRGVWYPGLYCRWDR